LEREEKVWIETLGPRVQALGHDFCTN
jgi:hypothetical protein